MKPELLIFDLDGTVYRGSDVISGAPEFFDELSRRKIPFLFATNRADRPPEQVRDVLRGMGISCETDQILTSSMAAADLVSGKRVFPVGGEGVPRALEQAGCTLVTEKADAVVVGFDLEITLEKLTTACRLILDGARFLGTNPDPTLITKEGLVPECGALLAAIETATGTAPEIVGKPEARMLEFACRKAGVRPENALMIGDFLDTDIRAAKAAGCRSLLLLTGITTLEQLADSPLTPDHVCADYADMGALLFQ